MPKPGLVFAPITTMRALFYITVALLYACNFTDKKTSTDSPAENAAKNKQGKACYAYLQGRDTIYLQLDINGKKAKGELSYSLFEKDANKGTFNGEFVGDTLIADYSFESEGTRSIRQIAFLREGERLVEGYGESVEQNGKMVFKNLHEIRFGTLMLTKVECTTH